MRLTGALSNSEGAERVEAAVPRVVEIRRKLGDSQAIRRAPLKPGLGALAEAIQHVMALADEPLRPIDIHERVEHQIGQPVSKDTVRSFLSVASRDDSSRIIRTAPGRYFIELDAM